MDAVRMKKPTARAGIVGAVLLTLLILAGGCWRDARDGLDLTLQLDRRSIETGDTLSGRLIVRNTTARHRSLVFPTTAQYSLCAYDALYRVVRIHPTSAGEMITYLELGPYGKHTYNFSFAAECNSTGRPIPPGRYRLTAELVPFDVRSPVTETVFFIR